MQFLIIEHDGYSDRQTTCIYMRRDFEKEKNLFQDIFLLGSLRTANKYTESKKSTKVNISCSIGKVPFFFSFFLSSFGSTYLTDYIPLHVFSHIHLPTGCYGP